MAEKRRSATENRPPWLTRPVERVTQDSSGWSFEVLTAMALRVLFRLDPARRDWVRYDTPLPGASGAKHEIDILLEIPRPERTRTVAVECKDHRTPVSKDKVAAFLSVLRDVNAARAEEDRLPGLMVSGSGFQSGARKMAAYYGIFLLELCKPDRKLWKKHIRQWLPPFATLEMTFDSSFPIFCDLTEEAEQAVLYAPEIPEWVITDPLNQWRAGIWLRERKIRRLPCT